MTPPSDQPQKKVDRQFERRKTLLTAKISTLDAIDDCLVRGISSGGAEVQIAAALQMDQKVTLTVPRLGPVEGRVAWVSEKLVGIQFLFPLDDAALSILAPPTQASKGGQAAGTTAKTSAVRRAELESRLIELSQSLSHAYLELAVDQITVMLRHGNRENVLQFSGQSLSSGQGE